MSGDNFDNGFPSRRRAPIIKKSRVIGEDPLAAAPDDPDIGAPNRSSGVLPKTALFLLLWLSTGFSLGTLCLLGPVRWWASLCRNANIGAGVEKAGVFGIIALLIAVSAAAAAMLAKAAFQNRAARVRLGIPAGAILLAACALAVWMHPQMLRSTMGAEETAPGSRFTFGPYPTEERMRELRRQDYTAIISLLHPAVVPFEPKLYEDERAMAARAGIDLIHVPLLPWISENEDGVERIRTIARSGRGRYYVHCYLGRDRVRLVKRIVEQAGAAATFTAESPKTNLNSVSRLERGEILKLEEARWLTPYPTDDEFMSFVLGGEVRQVVSLMDPDDPDQRTRIEDERKLLDRYGVAFEVIPLKNDPCDPRAALEASRRIHALPAPLLVHAFFDPGSGREPAAESVLGAYRSGRATLPSSAFRKRLDRGPAELIAPHVAAGPRPAAGEFRQELYRRGVREVLYLGDGRSAEAREDRAAAERAGLTWRAVADPISMLSNGGPWYLYGPGLPAARDRIAGAVATPTPTPTPGAARQSRLHAVAP